MRGDFHFPGIFVAFCLRSGLKYIIYGILMPENEVKVYILEHKMGVEDCFVTGFSIEHMVCVLPKVCENT